MVFGNAAWGFRETPLEEQFKITSEMGLPELELGIANAPMDIPVDISDEELLKIKKTAEKYWIKLTCAATGNDFTTGTEDTAKIKKVIDICSKAEIRFLRIFAGFTPLAGVTDAAFAQMIKALSEVCRYAEEKNVVPVMETHGGVDGYDDGVIHIPSVTTDLETLKIILSLIPDNARVCFDPANLFAVGITNPNEFYKEIKDKVAYAHFKDFKKLPTGRLKPSFCGDSDMNWKAILEEMRDFDGICMFEYENTEDIKEGLRKSYDYIKNAICEE